MVVGQDTIAHIPNTHGPEAFKRMSCFQAEQLSQLHGVFGDFHAEIEIVPHLCFPLGLAAHVEANLFRLERRPQHSLLVA